MITYTDPDKLPGWLLALGPFHSILCLDGDLPPAAFFQHNKLPVIAADGAANTLALMGIQPDLVIGDLDSINPALLDTLKSLHRPDQNFSDYQKSLHYLEEKSLLPAVVCGIDGGTLDHVINNISIFLQSNSVLYSPHCIGYVLHENKMRSHSLPLNTKISLIGMPHACISSTGLQWELSDFIMSFPGTNSCFNRTTQERVELRVQEGRALVLIQYNPVN